MSINSGTVGLLRCRFGRSRLVRLTALAGLAGLLALTACTPVSSTPRSAWGVNAGGAVDVYAVARVGGLVVVGGNFSQLVSPDGRTTRPAAGLAALDAATGAPVWTAAPGGAVYRIVASGSSLWVAGAFGVKRYSTSGADLAYRAPEWVGQVHALAVGGGRVYYAGSRGVVATTTAGTRVWTAPLDGPAYALALARGGTRLLVGGVFCHVGGVSRPGLASLGTNGAVDLAFRASNFGCGSYLAARSVLDIAVDPAANGPRPAGSTAYVAGGGSLNRVAAVDARSGATVWAAPRGDGDVQAVSVYDGAVYAGGHFTCVAGGETTPCQAPRLKLARYSTAGQLDPVWAPSMQGGFWGVLALTADGTGLYAGGNFSAVSGIPHSKLAIFPRAG